MERGNTRARETETRHPLGRWHASPLLLSLVAIFARFNWGTTRNLLFTFRITGNKWRSAASASVRLRETHINLSCGVAACFLIKQCEVNIELMFVFPVSRVLFSLVFGGEKSPGVLPYKSDGGARRKISRTPIKGTSNLVFRACPKFISTLRGINSTTTNYITGTANFKGNKDNFRTLSFRGLFESIYQKSSSW